MFGRATIRLGIGPHSSSIYCGFVLQLAGVFCISYAQHSFYYGFAVQVVVQQIQNKQSLWTLCDMDIELMTFNPARPFFSPCR